ncbi:hypothetical protein LAZ67_20001994 [Cordylochernes scorpioides]|uniref:DUF5641 domain-containing protein n=1 Tax=Cordylochernes scorpioides TaxID=51811 RepID=A0ABY6LMY2_9ARAC|nr:hypothetical protein LAZ67_20001994 [Cordylochernes scorpioides]
MQHGLADQPFSNYDEVKKWIDEWIAAKEPAFFRDGIRQLPERWGKVVGFSARQIVAEMSTLQLSRVKYAEGFEVVEVDLVGLLTLILKEYNLRPAIWKFNPPKAAWWIRMWDRLVYTMNPLGAGRFQDVPMHLYRSSRKDVVLIGSNDKKNVTWPLGRMIELFEQPDGSSRCRQDEDSEWHKRPTSTTFVPLGTGH